MLLTSAAYQCVFKTTTNGRFKGVPTPMGVEKIIYRSPLKGGYPAKLKKVLIVTAPLWFKAPFKILRLFVREKLRERVYTVSVAQLLNHIPRESLPTQLGGSLILDHHAWLLHCVQSMNTRPDSPLVNYGQEDESR
ncbi:unnamed protein product [Brassicogethes aeneus]|uniref:CRAL-TRIO domain-containing protein n=1 Tax=Brassicogethes aeneus TaxID=1431903 RepID=A0A9P0FGS3_BRAAE|nr:unnamed protein product [Brassicogethes aeneus]